MLESRQFYEYGSKKCNCIVTTEVHPKAIWYIYCQHKHQLTLVDKYMATKPKSMKKVKDNAKKGKHSGL